MIYNIAKTLVDHEDNVAKEFVKGVETEITVKMGLIKALLAEGTQSVEEKMKRFELFLKLKAAEVEAELSAEEAALLHKAVEVFPTLVMGQLKRFIDQK